MNWEQILIVLLHFQIQQLMIKKSQKKVKIVILNQ